MTLATRCPTCGTVFRVVQDQLRVSQGWVRCGRCSEAFNALESMVEVPTVLAPDPRTESSAEPFAPTDFGPTAVMEWPEAPHAPTAHPPPAAAASPASAAQAAPTPPVAMHRGPGSPADEDVAFVTEDLPHAGGRGPSLLDLPIGMNLIASDGAVVTPATATDDPDRTEPVYDVTDDPSTPVDVLNPEAPAHDPAAQPFVVMAQATPPSGVGPTPGVADAAAPGSTPDRAPSFLLRAERAEQWRRPGVRLALSAAALMLGVGLAAQVVHAFRDRLVASTPSLRPVLQQACSVMGCTVGDWRQIDALTVESTGLVRVDGAPVYRLSVTLRNRAAIEVAAPALDLSLTDASGKPIARRVLQMSDLYLPLRTLKPGSELPIQVSLGIGDRPVSGYTVEIFYP